MIDTHLLTGVLLALAVLIGAAIVLSATMLAAACIARHGQAPYGGTPRNLPQNPLPDADSARVLVPR